MTATVKYEIHGQCWRVEKHVFSLNIAQIFNSSEEQYYIEEESIRNILCV